MARLVLDTRDLESLGQTFEILLSSAEGPADVWAEGVRGAVKELLGADCSAVLIPSADGSMVFMKERPVSLVQVYFELYEEMNRRFDTMRRGAELGVYSRESLWPDMPAYYASTYYNEFILPNVYHDAIGINVPLATPITQQMSAQIILHHDHPTRRQFGDRGLSLLRLVYPVFAHAVRMHLRFAARMADMARLVDGLSDGLRMCDHAGFGLHDNPALTALLAADPESARIEFELERVAREVAVFGCAGIDTADNCCQPPVRVELATAKSRYTIGSMLISESTLPNVRVMISLIRRTVELPTIEHLQSRFSLTRSQARVALLLVEGLSNEQVAARLVISEHTARHHTEQVLHKLGVHSRSQVARRIRD